MPNVSYCEDNNEVHYHPYVPPFFCKLTLNNGETIELEGSGELTSAMISKYKSAVVDAEIGTQCTSIGNFAFNRCSGLTSVTIGSGVTSVGDYTFSACTSLTSIDIPDSVTRIGTSAFDRCSGLTSIEIPDSVTSIDNSAFANCSGFTSIEIPNSVTTIGMSAFQRCSSLTSVTIGDSVTRIMSYVFQYCSSLTSITSLAMTAPTIDSYTFQSIKSNGTLTVPSGSSGYDVWMGTSNYYLGRYNWSKVEQ